MESNLTVDYKLDYADTFDDIQKFSNMMEETHEFSNFMKTIFKWFITRKERDQNDAPLIGTDFKSLSMNEVNTIGAKLMEHGPTITKAVIDSGLVPIYMSTMSWKTTLGENLDVMFRF